jgi:TatD DNase family protein
VLFRSEEVIERARRNDVARIVTVGTDRASCEKACAIAAAHDGVFAAIAYHPHESDRHAGDDLSALRALAASPKVVAIGETGLDYAKKHASVENQKALFKRHLSLAAELDKPVVIHCRDAHEDTRAILRESGARRVVLHCFSGSREDARAYIEMGFYLSVAGPITFKNAQALRDAIRSAPLDRLLVETDCPYLAPAPNRGKRNEPAWVLYTAAEVARVHGVAPERVAEATSQNAREVFRIP